VHLPLQMQALALILKNGVTNLRGVLVLSLITIFGVVSAVLCSNYVFSMLHSPRYTNNAHYKNDYQNLPVAINVDHETPAATTSPAAGTPQPVAVPSPKIPFPSLKHEEDGFRLPEHDVIPKLSKQYPGMECRTQWQVIRL
jgi:hypothetical protein